MSAEATQTTKAFSTLQSFPLTVQMINNRAGFRAEQAVHSFCVANWRVVGNWPAWHLPFPHPHLAGRSCPWPTRPRPCRHLSSCTLSYMLPVPPTPILRPRAAGCCPFSTTTWCAGTSRPQRKPHGQGGAQGYLPGCSVSPPPTPQSCRPRSGSQALLQLEQQRKGKTSSLTETQLRAGPQHRPAHPPISCKRGNPT